MMTPTISLYVLMYLKNKYSPVFAHGDKLNLFNSIVFELLIHLAIKR